MSGVVPPRDYQLAVGERLRTVRRQQGLSLRQVQDKSGGLWPAAVMGSYERGSRAVTVERLACLAEFYGVPVSALLPRGEAARRPRLVVSLPALLAAPLRADPVRRYAQAIRAQRGDWAGDVLSLRNDDVRALAAVLDTDTTGLIDQLAAWAVLAPASVTSADELIDWAEPW